MKNKASFTAINRNKFLTTLLACGLATGLATATERRFTYSYEPETLPKGAAEFEQSVTLGTQRTKGGDVMQENYNKWKLREELELGVTDKYTLGLYLNFEAESFRDTSVSPAVNESEFKFGGVSIENRYMLLNPAEHAVGLTLYLEPTFGGDEAELEQKIIFGQRYGDWKWALNLSHATEWADNFHSTEGELDATFGITRDIHKNWSLGLEFRNHNAMPEYDELEHTVFYLGPVLSYRTEKWWTTLTIMPQIYGKDFQGNPDNNKSLVLDAHERLEVRFLFGVSF